MLALEQVFTSAGSPSQVVELIAGISKDDWATASPDPLEELLGSILAQAPPDFWNEFSEGDILPTVSRVRNWLLKMIQAERKSQCGSALEFLLKLRLSKDTLAHIKLAPILKSFIAGSPVADLARTLAQQYGIPIKLAAKGLATPPGTPPPQTAGATSAASASPGASSSSAPASPGSAHTSELAVLKRQDRKRPREEEAPVQKRRKYGLKTVSWKSDDELLSVRQFDLELEPKTLEPEYVTAHEPRDEQERPLFSPIKSKVGIPQPLREMLGIKRGGLVVPPASAANDGPTFEPGHSPHEPLPPKQQVKTTVIKITQF